MPTGEPLEPEDRGDPTGEETHRASPVGKPRHSLVRSDGPVQDVPSLTTSTLEATGTASSAPLEGAGGVRWALRIALWPWLVSRVLVAGALGVARILSTTGHLSATARARVQQGLLGWDAGWYESIARHGYWGASHASLRFFPLVPAAARALSSVLPFLGVGGALVVVTNASALVGLAWLAALARREGSLFGSQHEPAESFARRAAWLMALAPPAFTMVMGYAEGTLLALSVGVFWALRRHRWWWAAVLGLFAGLCRPIGVFLVVPALVEAVRTGSDDAGRSGRVGRACSVLAPAAGFGAFLGWVGWRYGDALAPLRIQEEGSHRGAFADPFPTLAHDASLLVRGTHLGTALHLPWVLLAIVLLVVCLRRFPVSYGGFAAAVLVAAVTTSNLDGFERYALSAFPLILAASTLVRARRTEIVLLSVSAAAMVGYAVLAFANVYVP
jgi:hypothetical protein